MKLLTTIEECRQFREEHSGKTLALIPTMGALHDGHLTLLEQAKEKADVVMVSIFVNPLQFGPNEDFERYPRPLEDDLEKCQSMGINAVFNPSSEQLYPNGQHSLTQIMPPAHLTDKLCGKSRPGHFVGVATVVQKLFAITQPDIAVFGKKDAQQLKIIEQMVIDLNLPITIVPAPTARAASGLALSSRNDYLRTELEQKAALVPFTVLSHIKSLTEQQNNLKQSKSFKKIAQQVWQQTLDTLKLDEKTITLDYLEAVDTRTFNTVDILDEYSKVLIACKIGKTRLIDNIDIIETGSEKTKQHTQPVACAV